MSFKTEVECRQRTGAKFVNVISFCVLFVKIHDLSFL